MARSRMVIALVACGAGLAAVLGITLAGGSAGNGSRLDRFRFRGDAYRYVVYVPSGRRSRPGMPLVVVLHGCTMTADEEAAATAYDQIAAARGFVVLYPDVDAVDRANGGCWKGIWDPGAEGRDRGDAGAIAAMTKTVIADWRIDPSRVYAIGISAGGFETSMLGAAYPDMYAAIGIHSGAGYLAAEHGCPARGSAGTITASARRCAGRHGVTRRRHAGHRLPRRPRWHRPVPVRPASAGPVADHRRSCPPVPTPRSAAPDPDRTRHSSVANDHAYTVLSLPTQTGCPVAQLWSIHGMGHYWSGGSAGPASARTRPARPRRECGLAGILLHWRGPAARRLRASTKRSFRTRCVSALKSLEHARKAPDQRAFLNRARLGSNQRPLACEAVEPMSQILATKGSPDDCGPAAEDRIGGDPRGSTRIAAQRSELCHLRGVAGSAHLRAHLQGDASAPISEEVGQRDVPARYRIAEIEDFVAAVNADGFAVPGTRSPFAERDSGRARAACPPRASRAFLPLPRQMCRSAR